MGASAGSITPSIPNVVAMLIAWPAAYCRASSSANKA